MYGDLVDLPARIVGSAKEEAAQGEEAAARTL